MQKKRKIIKYENLFSLIKLVKEIIVFGDIETKKHKCYRYKNHTFLKDINFEIALVSSKIYFGEKNYKYFFGYLYDDYKIKPFHIMLSEMRAYVKSYDGQKKWICF